MFTLLHISDLHRSPDEPVDNSTLLAALLNDQDRCRSETPAIPSPDAIVVSGDIIQGAKLDQENWQLAIEEQYAAAEDFLCNLTAKLLDGDRSRMILVPGNHDVCWNTAYDAMQRVPDGDPARKNIRRALDQPGSDLRWSWSKLDLFRITAPDKYARRLEAYRAFLQRFYFGVPLTSPIQPDRGFQLFDLDGGRIVVAALDSIYGNDCFAYSGGFAPGLVGSCYMELRERPVQPMLKMGVWHHSVQGPPRHDDYMDVSEVYSLAGHGFQLGLHGHQHVAAASAYYIHRQQAQEMAVVSGGSLCAGARELPRGVNRQYNVVVIRDDYLGARLHVREMGDGGHFSRKMSAEFVEGFVELEWQPPLDPAGRVVDVDVANERSAVESAEAALGRRDPDAALSILKKVRLPAGSYARRLAADIANRIEDWKFLAELLQQPTSQEESTLLVSALMNLGEFAAAKLALAGAGLQPAMATALNDRIEVMQKMRGK
ncbi:MAG: metallophosphoesterase [Hyphomonadaceae bacterium]|nr:metallophosphoesterase [Hyphomonadaceae bacterium]